jgi:hypothetical protein
MVVKRRQWISSTALALVGHVYYLGCHRLILESKIGGGMVDTVPAFPDFVVLVGHALPCTAGGLEESAPHPGAVALGLFLRHVFPVDVPDGLPASSDLGFCLLGLFHDC